MPRTMELLSAQFNSRSREDWGCELEVKRRLASCRILHRTTWRWALLVVALRHARDWPRWFAFLEVQKR
jgi:hypothetical protein